MLHAWRSSCRYGVGLLQRRWPWGDNKRHWRTLALYRVCETGYEASSSVQSVLLSSALQAHRRFSKTSQNIMVVKGYKEAVEALNSLQSNATVLASIKQHGDRGHANLPATTKYLARAGVSLTHLEKLSFIHVTGTKGKGSTCAFTERLLRQRGYKTGLYTSPHLVSVTERIRLNGCPINKQLFTTHFWCVYNALQEQKEHNEDMPPYFMFLTVLAFKVFLAEGVDVAILEVGIGGEYDCTNIIRAPVCCGLSSVDIDHTHVLGHTLASIAWHKAGIIKPRAGVFCATRQPSEALRVILDRAREQGCVVHECPELNEYGRGKVGDGTGGGGREVVLGLAGVVQRDNASLALQLSRHWLLQHDHHRSKDAGSSELPAVAADDNSTGNSDITGNGSSSDINGNGNAGTIGDSINGSSVTKDSAINGNTRTGGGDINGGDVTGGGGVNSDGGNNDVVAAATAFQLEEDDFVALRNTYWPGRSQVVRRGPRLTYFLDGAHTAHSIRTAAVWFSSAAAHTQPRSAGDEVYRVLVFNTTGERDSQAMLSTLLQCNFNLAVFPTNMTTANPLQGSDQTNLTVSEKTQHMRCQKHIETWYFLRAKAAAVLTPAVSAAAMTATSSAPVGVASEAAATTVKTNVVDRKELGSLDSLRESELCGTDDVQNVDKSQTIKSTYQSTSSGNILKNVNHQNTLNQQTITNVSRESNENVMKTPQNDQFSVTSEQPASHPRGSTISLPNSSSQQADSTISKTCYMSQQTSFASSQTDHRSQQQNSAPSQTNFASQDGSAARTSATEGTSSLDAAHMLQLRQVLSGGEESNDGTAVVAVVIPYLQDTLEWLSGGKNKVGTGEAAAVEVERPTALKDAAHVQVLVTGSLHLVGGVLGLLDPNLCSSGDALREESLYASCPFPTSPPSLDENASQDLTRSIRRSPHKCV